MSIESEIWTVADIAEYYGRSVRQARRIVADPEFPPTVRGDNRRWLAAQVRSYAAGSWEAVTPSASTTVLRPGTASNNRIVRRRAA